MSVDGGPEHRVATPPLPGSIWLVAWASLAGQAGLLVGRGGRLDDAVSIAVSVVVGGLLVGYVSAGVVRARTIRLVLAWVVLILSAIADFLGLFFVDDRGETAVAAFSLATTVLALAGLAMFRRSDWYAWQRTKPSRRDGARIGQLVAIGVLVGMLGGLVGSTDDGFNLRVDLESGGAR